MTKAIKTVDVFNKGSRAFQGYDKEMERKYTFAPDSKQKFSEAEAKMLLDGYPDECVSFDAVVVKGISFEKYDAEVKAHAETKKQLEEAKAKILEITTSKLPAQSSTEKL